MKARNTRYLAVANAASNEVSSETQRASICDNDGGMMEIETPRDFATQSRKRLIGKFVLAERIKAAAVAILLLIAWAIVSEMDYQDAIAVAPTHCIYRGI